jgi:hypothetical protein
MEPSYRSRSVSAGQRYLTFQSGDRAADQHALDLAGALEDGEDFGVTLEPF